MTKWTANLIDLLKNIPGTLNEENMSLELGTDALKRFGLFWRPKDDYLSYNIQLSTIDKNTKRNILSCKASLFDPLGVKQ